MDEVNVNTQVVENAVDVEEPVQTDLEKLEAALAQLKVASEDLFADQIQELETKIATEKAKVEAEVEKVVEVVNQTEQTFVQKYGAGAARAVEIALLALILYKLF